MKRKTIGKRLRFEVFARDAFTCRYCGAQSDTVVLVIDHMIPVAQGGTNDIENLLTACEPCNQGKAAKTIEQATLSEPSKLALAQERNEQMAALRLAKNAADARKELRQMVVDFWCGETGRDDVDRGTITTMLCYVEQFGMEMVMNWIARAAATAGRLNDSKMGMYVSGIRRHHIEEIKEEGF